MSQNEIQFFANAKPRLPVTSVFATDTRHPGVLHARMLYLLEHALVTEALQLANARMDVLKSSTVGLLMTHPASRHLFQ